MCLIYCKNHEVMIIFAKDNVQFFLKLQNNVHNFFSKKTKAFNSFAKKAFVAKVHVFCNKNNELIFIFSCKKTQTKVPVFHDVFL